jgi:hypothetical protein
LLSKLGRSDKGLIPTQLNYDQHCITRDGWDNGRKYPTPNDAFDLIKSIEHGTPHGWTARNKILAQLNPPYFRNSMPSLPPLEENIAIILNFARRAIVEAKAENISLGIEENGLVCYVPSETRVGDLVCQFQDSDILVIIQKLRTTPRRAGEGIGSIIR